MISLQNDRSNLTILFKQLFQFPFFNLEVQILNVKCGLVGHGFFRKSAWLSEEVEALTLDNGERSSISIGLSTILRVQLVCKSTGVFSILENSKDLACLIVSSW